MIIKTPNYKGVVLETAGKCCSENITVETDLVKYSGEHEINWLIEQYTVAAGATINAGDFVEFINTTEWGIHTISDNAISSVSACKLNNNSILVAYRNEGDTSYGYGIAIVLTLENSIVTRGTPVIFHSASIGLISATALNENKALVVFNDSSNTYYGKAVVLSINNTEVTVGTAITFNSARTYEIQATTLSETKVLVAYRDYSNSNYGEAIVFNISGTTITKGTAVTFNNAQTYDVSITTLSSTKALVAYYDVASNTYNSNVRVLSVSGTSITVGSEFVFNASTMGEMSVVALNENKALVAYRDGANSSCGTARVLNISGTSITAGEEVVFESSKTFDVVAATLSEDKVLVIYYDNSNSNYGTSRVLSVDGTNITAGEKTVFYSANTRPYSLIAFSSTSAVGFYENYSSSTGFYQGLSVDNSTVTKHEIAVQPTTSTTYTTPIAKTGGSAGETVEVYVYPTNE